MKVLGGIIGGIAPYSFMALELEGVIGQSHALSMLYPKGKDSWHPPIGWEAGRIPEPV
jgi:hypothetical protein